MTFDYTIAKRALKLKTGGIPAEIVAINGSQYTSDGKIWVRLPGGYDDGSNANTVRNTPFKVRPKYGNFIDKVGRKVWIGLGYDNEIEIKDNIEADLKQRNIDPRQMNRNNASARYTLIDSLVELNAFPTGGDLTIKVMPSIYRKPDGTYGIFSGESNTDLTSYLPATSTNQVVVCEWLNPNDNTTTLTASSELAQTVDLKNNPTTALTYINECVTQAPSQNIGIRSWILRGDDTEITEENKFHDLRGIIGAGSSVASPSYPNPVTTGYSIPSGHTMLFKSGWRIPAGGSVRVPAGSAICGF